MEKLEFTISSKYKELETIRKPILDRAVSYSKLTLPYILPEESTKESDELPKKYSSIGALGSKHLGNKTLLGILPPEIPFFRLNLDEEIKNGEKQVVNAITEQLFNIETKILNYVNSSSIRVPILQSLLSLIITGNSLIYIPSKKRRKFTLTNSDIRVYKLHNYVIERDNFGNVLTIIIKESMSPKSLPQSIKDTVLNKLEDKTKKNIDLYTMINLSEDGKFYELRQEVEEEIIKETIDLKINLEDNPFIPLRWTAISGENYGRSYIEDLFPDLESLENIMKTYYNYTSLAGKTVFLVRKNGSTRIGDFARAINGDIIGGNREDISSIGLGSEKLADLSVIENTKNGLEMSLSKAFMLNTSIQRNAERVTAEEIKYMAQELETMLGGVYSLLAQELQLPLVKRIMKILTEDGVIPKLPNTINPTIITGVEALGRTNDANKVTQFIQMASTLLGPEQVQQNLDINGIFTILGVGLGLDVKKILKTPEQVQQEQQSIQDQQMAQQMAPEMLKQQNQG